VSQSSDQGRKVMTGEVAPVQKARRGKKWAKILGVLLLLAGQEAEASEETVLWRERELDFKVPSIGWRPASEELCLALHEWCSETRFFTHYAKRRNFILGIDSNRGTQAKHRSMEAQDN